MSLLKLLKDDDARRIFGKRELKIIEKQMMGVDLTQSEKNRLSRDVRKKLAFVIKLARFSDSFMLKKGAEVARIVDYAVDVIKVEKDVKKIFLFDSAVSGNRTLRSDIDIAVSLGKLSSRECTLFRKKMLGKVHQLVDVQVFEMLPENIRKDILRTGKLLYNG